jgi:Xaa-Pro aminopeptidase
MIEALNALREGQAEWEIEARAHSTMRQMGAEGTSYPIWVCSGPNTHQSLCRSTNRRIKSNELVQLTFGARYMGYCGNMCRPFSIGKPPERALNLMSVALEAVEGALRDIRPGAAARDVFQNYYETLARYGFEEFTLYGPAHGTGTSEVEGLWLGAGSDTIIQAGMHGILGHEDGIEELTSYRREIILL